MARTAPGAAAARAKRGREHLWSRAPTARPPFSESLRQREPRAAIVCEAPPPGARPGRARGYGGTARRRGSRGPRPSSADGSAACRPERSAGPGAAVPLSRGRRARATGTDSSSAPRLRPPPPGLPALPSEPLPGASAPPRKARTEAGKRPARARSAPECRRHPPSAPRPRRARGSQQTWRRGSSTAGGAPLLRAAQHSAPPPPHKMAAAHRTARRRDHTSSALSLPSRGATRPASLGGNFRRWPRPPLRHADFRAVLGYRKCCRVLLGAALVRASCGRSAGGGEALRGVLAGCGCGVTALCPAIKETTAVPWNCALRE